MSRLVNTIIKHIAENAFVMMSVVELVVWCYKTMHDGPGRNIRYIILTFFIKMHSAQSSVE